MNGLSSGRSGCGIELVDGCHQLEDRFLAELVVRTRQRGRCRTTDDRNVVAVELALGQLLADFHLDQLEDFLVVDQIDLVQEHDHRRHADLLGEQDVLLGLRHRAVGGGDDQDRAVHLRGTGDHVLHIIGVARAIDVRVVARCRLVLDVCGRDRDAALALFRSLVDVGEIDGGAARRLCQHLGDRGRQRRLAVIDVTDGADVEMRLVPLEFCLCHFRLFLNQISRPVRRHANAAP